MKLYHGSARKLIGNKLIPKQGRDVYDNSENLHKAVYATDLRNAAIAMAIISCEGVRGGGLNISKNVAIPGIIYKGNPEQNDIYLYILDSKGFKPTKKGGHQFISKEPVKPLKTEKLKVKDYAHLTRKANKKELNKFNNRR